MKTCTYTVYKQVLYRALSTHFIMYLYMGLFGFRTKSLYFCYLGDRKDFPQDLTVPVFFFSVFSMIHYKCLSGCCHHGGAAVANRSFMWVDILTHSCMWVQEMLHVRSFFVSLIEAVASEQLAEILFFRYNWLVGCVLQICMVSSLLMRC